MTRGRGADDFRNDSFFGDEFWGESLRNFSKLRFKKEIISKILNFLPIPRTNERRSVEEISQSFG